MRFVFNAPEALRISPLPILNPTPHIPLPHPQPHIHHHPQVHPNPTLPPTQSQTVVMRTAHLWNPLLDYYDVKSNNHSQH